MPTADTVEVIYNDHYAGFREDPVFHRAASRVLAEEIAARVPPPARLLDVGCGNGEFLAIARGAGYEVEGIDVSTSAQTLCRERGISVRVGDLRSAASFAADERFDVITFWDVVEHLPDPRSFLDRSRELLGPDGHVLIKTPRTSPTSVRIAAAMPRLGRPLLQAPSHLQYFQRSGLARLLRDAGFGIQHWVDVHAMRAAATGGSVWRRATRLAMRVLREAAGDGNLLVLAQRT